MFSLNNHYLYKSGVADTNKKLYKASFDSTATDDKGVFTFMKKQKKGCVYFFKHTGLKPIKIGYTNNESPINRFNQFKTYAPFGAEIIGFIKTTEAKKIETKLHNKYSSLRMDGEWFEISEKQIKTEIDFYTSKEDIKLKNDFQIAWAKSLDVKKENILIKLDQEKLTKFEAFKILYKDTKSATKLSKKLKVSRSMIYRYIKKLNK